MMDHTPDARADELLTVPQVASELKVDRRTVYKWLKAGELPGLKLGRRWIWRVRRSELTAYLDARKT